MLTRSEMRAISNTYWGRTVKTEYEQNVWDANYQDDALKLIEDKVGLLLAVGLSDIADEVATELGIPVEMAESELPDMVRTEMKRWI